MTLSQVIFNLTTTMVDADTPPLKGLSWTEANQVVVNNHVTKLKELYNSKGYRFFDNDRIFNLNIIGWRLMNRPNRFDDEIWLVYRNAKLQWCIDRFTGTTKPGPVYLNAPMNKNGCAIIKEGQYPGVWKLGTYKGKPALVQDKPFTIYRDKDRDEEYDMVNEQQSNNGTLHLHKMCNATIAPRVNSWSAGCQGLNNPMQYVKAFDMIQKSANIYGDYFTYTLFDLVYGE